VIPTKSEAERLLAEDASETRKMGVKKRGSATFTVFRSERCGIFRAEFSNLPASRRIANGMRVGTLMHNHHSELAHCIKRWLDFFLITVNSESPTTFCGDMETVSRMFHRTGWRDRE
jgi:hypothetical protein